MDKKGKKERIKLTKTLLCTEKSVVRNESEDWKLGRIVISQSAYLLEIQYLGMFKEDSNIRVVSMWYMWENFCID